MTITSGRRPSDVHRREQVERLGAPACLADDVDIGLAAEERKQPAAHDLVVVNHQDTDGLVPAGLHLRSCPDRPGRGLVRVSRPRRARDREPPVDLGRTGPHRVQAEVTGMVRGWVEAVPVVTDLDDDLRPC